MQKTDFENTLCNLQYALQDIAKLANPFFELLSQLSVRVTTIIKENGHHFKAFVNFLEEFEKWPEQQKQMLIESAHLGWFINWETYLSGMQIAIEKGQEALDIEMSEQISANWSLLKEKILNFCTERAHILNTAFELHEQENFIASIPLFLSQIDGICAQHINAYLFTERDKLQDVVEKYECDNSETFIPLIIAPLAEQTQFKASISKKSQELKSKAPNRNGILHGSRKHLDYGTKLNSLKAFSLLAYCVFVLADPESKEQL